MNKKLEETLIWGFMILSLILAIFFLVDTFTKINQVEQLEGKYTYVCKNGTKINFTEVGPKFLCGDPLSPNPLITNEIFFGGNVTWQPELK